MRRTWLRGRTFVSLSMITLTDIQKSKAKSYSNGNLLMLKCSTVGYGTQHCWSLKLTSLNKKIKYKSSLRILIPSSEILIFPAHRQAWVAKIIEHLPKWAALYLNLRNKTRKNRNKFRCQYPCNLAQYHLRSSLNPNKYNPYQPH